MTELSSKEIRTVLVLYRKVDYANPGQIAESLELLERRSMLVSPKAQLFKERLASFCDENSEHDLSCVFCGEECIDRKGLICASCEEKLRERLESFAHPAQPSEQASGTTGQTDKATGQNFGTSNLEKDDENSSECVKPGEKIRSAPEKFRSGFEQVKIPRKVVFGAFIISLVLLIAGVIISFKARDLYLETLEKTDIIIEYINSES